MPGWAGFYAWSADREPRPLLLARGWSVLAVDAEEEGLAMLRSRVPAAAAGRLQLACASFTVADLPSAVRRAGSSPGSCSACGPKHWHLFDVMARSPGIVPSER